MALENIDDALVAATGSKRNIFRMALLSLNYDYNKIMANYEAYVEAYNDAVKNGTAIPQPAVEEPLESQYLETFFYSACTYCASIRPWYWLIDHETYRNPDKEDDTDDRVKENGEYISYKGHDFAYRLPTDDKEFLYPYLVDGEYNDDYVRDSEYIYFKHPVSRIDYISGTTTVTDWICPKIYEALVAARLAIEIAPFIAPETNVEQRATQQFQLTLAAASKIDEQGTRKRNPNPKEFIL